MPTHFTPTLALLAISSCQAKKRKSELLKQDSIIVSPRQTSEAKSKRTPSVRICPEYSEHMNVNT